MESGHFSLLPHIVLLEIFTYLSNEDALFAFADLHRSYISNVLVEHGTFRHICLSSQLFRNQYQTLSKGIWRYDLVRSLTCNGIFADCLPFYSPCKIFPSLNKLRLVHVRCILDELSEYVIAHSSTLTHISMRRNQFFYMAERYQIFWHTVLPHLNKLKLLDTEWESDALIQWDQFKGCLPSLEHLNTDVETLTELYALANDGRFPYLRSLRIAVTKAVIKRSFTEVPVTTNLRIPNLERFDLVLKGRGEQNEEEKQVEWTNVETLTSQLVMPRLRQFSLLYTLSSNDEIEHILQSSHLEYEKRKIHFQFELHMSTTISIDSPDTANVYVVPSSVNHYKYMHYINENGFTLHRIWFTLSWPSWTMFWIRRDNIAPSSGARKLVISSPNFSLHSFGKLFPKAVQLECSHPASISVINSSSVAPTPLINLRSLIVQDVVPGVEHLLDGTMLPQLQSLDGTVTSLFVAFARRTNPMKTLDTVNHLMIMDQLDRSEKSSISLKQWHTVLDVLPRLRSLRISLHHPKCPPVALADLFIDYIERRGGTTLSLFSWNIDDCTDVDNKINLTTYLEKKIETVSPSAHLVFLGSAKIDAWM